MTSEKEQQLAQLIERVHEVRQSLQHLFMRISSLHKHLKCLCIEHLLHSCFSCTLHSLHLALVLQSLALDIFLCHLRRNILYFRVADISRFPHVALNHLRSSLEQSVRSRYRVQYAACTGFFDNRLCIQRSESVVTHKVQHGFFHLHSVSRIGFGTGYGNLLSVAGYLQLAVVLGIKSVDGSSEIRISHVHRIVSRLQFILLRCAVSIVTACGEDDAAAFGHFNILFKDQRLPEVVIFCNVDCKTVGDKISVRLLCSAETEHRIAIFCQQDAVVRNLFETLYALTCSGSVDILDAAEQNTRNTLHSTVLAVLNYYILVLFVAEEWRVFGRSNMFNSTDSTFISGTRIPLLVAAATDITITVTLNYKICDILQLSRLSQHLTHAGLLRLNECLAKILIFDSLNGILCRPPVNLVALLDDKAVGIQILLLFLCKESCFLVEHRDDLNRLCLREHLCSLLCEGVDLFRAVILESGIQIVDVSEHVDELL